MTIQRIEEEIISSDIDGEVVLFNLESGKYFGFNETSSRIWDLIEQPIDLGELVSALTTDYQIDAETCEAEVRGIVKQLVDNELAVVNE